MISQTTILPRRDRVVLLECQVAAAADRAAWSLLLVCRPAFAGGQAACPLLSSCRASSSYQPPLTNRVIQVTILYSILNSLYFRKRKKRRNKNEENGTFIFLIDRHS